MRPVVVIPTFNERENIVDLLRVLRVTVPTAQLMVVDDLSPDGTGMLADTAAAELGSITVVHRHGRPGLGAAYRHGFSLAFEEGFDVVVSMDSDFSHDPSVIPTMLRLIDEGADVVPAAVAAAVVAAQAAVAATAAAPPSSRSSRLSGFMLTVSRLFRTLRRPPRPRLLLLRWR